MKTLGFLQAHRLSLKKDIDSLFLKGNSVQEFPFRFVWHHHSEKSNAIKVIISVPKKRIPHAVDRNYVKRIIREYFRNFYNQNIDLFKSGEFQIAVIIQTSDISKISNQIDSLQKGFRKICCNA